MGYPQCDSCQIVYINGVRCHEHGCPDAWKDYDRECEECGCDFRPESKWQHTCDGCLADQCIDAFHAECNSEDGE